MQHKADKVAALIKPFEGRGLDARYLGFFACFNRHQFFEAHEVLEELWLPVRHGPNGAFYKGLIQLAGAFVHVQHSRPGPALALLKLAQTNLQQFPAVHDGLAVGTVLQMIEAWIRTLASTGPALAPSGPFRADLQLPVPSCAGAAMPRLACD
jgi:uncharacterized protein